MKGGMGGELKKGVQGQTHEKNDLTSVAKRFVEFRIALSAARVMGQLPAAL